MREIEKLLKVMDILKDFNKELPLQHIRLLLTVAEQPGVTMPELASMLDSSQGAVSRNVKTLSKYVEKEVEGWEEEQKRRARGETGKVAPAEVKGYGLLRVEPDLLNRKSLAVYLTDRGEELISKLAGVLGSQPRRAVNH